MRRLIGWLIEWLMGWRSGTMLLKLVIGISLFTWIMTLPALAQTSSFVAGWHPQDWLRDALRWVDQLGCWGGVAFIAIYAIATVAFLPGSILTLGAGVVFGIVLGVIYVLIGASLGAIAAFWVGRYLARGWVAQRLEHHASFKAIDRAVSQEGFKIVLLTRLSPIFPFNLLNYALGLTGVSLRDYCFGLVGMIPATILYVYIGSLASNLAQVGTDSQPTNPSLQGIVWTAGLITLVATSFYITRVARKALAEKIEI